MADRILVVDDEEATRLTIARALQAEGWDVVGAESAETARAALEQDKYALLILDRRLPDEDGVDLLKDLRRLGCDCPVIIITGHPSVETAVDALREHAFDYLAKPFRPAEVVRKVQTALEGYAKLDEHAYLHKSWQKEHDFDCVLSRDPTTQQTYVLAMRVADTPATVLIEGESGTGKEYLARAMHYASRRASQRMVCLSCAALPDTLLESELFGHEKGAFTNALVRKVGLFELADGGTLFLDEIGDISPALQVKLLRFLQEKSFQRLGGTALIEVDVRVIAATNKRLFRMVQEGKFREDLYYRLSVVPLRLAPLRERREDIPVFVRHFLIKYGLQFHARPLDIEEEALAILVKRDWPGNIRELENSIQRAAILTPGNVVRACDLLLDGEADFESTDRDTSESTLEAVEREHIRRVLVSTGWNRARAAAVLGIDRKTLRTKMRKHRIEPQESLL